MKYLYLLASTLMIMSSAQAQWIGTGTTGDISRTGNVGIGTINPNYKLEVRSSVVGQASFIVSESTTGTNYGIDAEAIGTGATKNVGGYFFAQGAASNYAVQIHGNSTGANNYAIYANSPAKSYFAGNIGIGTSSPNYKLKVRSSVVGQASFIVSESTTGTNYGVDAEAIGTGATKNVGGYFFAQGAASNYAVQIHGNSTGANNYAIYANSPAKSYFAGNIGIGTTTTGSHKLAVEGSIGASGWSDFVFANNYKLQPLEEVEDYISENKHLPEIPSEAEVMKNEINLGEMDAKLLQKIEELTLYLIEQNKWIN